MQVLTLDFETRDPAIAMKRGAGWCFDDFDILGYSYKLGSMEPATFSSNIQLLKDLVSNSTCIIAHNAQYELGCLTRLGIDYRRPTVIDTHILAILYDNSMFSHSLDSLASDLLGKRKDIDLLKETAASLGIRRYMENISEIFKVRPDVVAAYANTDVELTYELSQWFKRNLYEEGLELIPFYSDLLKALVAARSKGVRVDMDKVAKSSDSLHALGDAALAEFHTYCPDVNINSHKALPEALIGLGLVPDVSPSGKPSVSKLWRSKQTHPAVKALGLAKLYKGLANNFVDNLTRISERGRIYPEIKILGGKETGRFSGSSPNIQNIPKRDELASPLIRALYLADEGDTIYSLDFSSQEPRIQIHYAFIANCKHADTIRQAFLDNPLHDIHQQVADLANIDRGLAKTINLGMSYGMGAAKMAAGIGIGLEEAKDLRKRYTAVAPYLAQLNKAVQESGARKGYIRTLLGRRVKMDYAKPYKALNKLIQGSAADQTAAAIVQAYRRGIDVRFSVHDELVLSTDNPDKARELKEIMENVIPLEVPCYTEILSGTSWAGKEPLI